MGETYENKRDKWRHGKIQTCDPCYVN